MRRALPLLFAALTLSGCISLFPKQAPSQLYRFDGADADPAAAAAGPEGFGVFRTRMGFQTEAAGDRILGVVGNEAAYIAEARWVAPANVLFEAAVARAFDGNAGPARLVTRGEISRASYGLRLDVRRFEAVYDQGRKAPPQVVVEVRAVLSEFRTRNLTAERVFTARVRAGDNRVSAIVDAFDQAVGQVLGEVVTWSNGRGA
ncbi:MAG: membrane integrity-associated transporter subunit PqiC [Caulobacteraceae bacterium]|nr:membrane integrity-associated transporter subunit PqiC [Caulobacteraceae bacterium]